MIDSRIEPASPFAEAELNQIEEFIGRGLPEGFRNFANTYGGAFVGGFVDGDSELPILAFFSAEAILTSLEAHPDLRGDGIIPIADCELGNLYVIDRGDTIHYINYYGGRTTSQKIASAFEEFLDRIVVLDE